MNNKFEQVTILETAEVPNGTYFTTGDAEPIIDEEKRTITILNGEGDHRSSWGHPQVTSTIIMETLDLVVVHVGFSHKHGGSQFWRYYAVNGGVKQISWGQLDDDTRQEILNSPRPAWAKVPGKLRKNYLSANPKKNAFTAYKVCAINEGGELTSLFNPDIVYQIGKTKVQKSQPDHQGGYYVHKDKDTMLALYEAGDLVAPHRMPEKFAVVKCECWGNQVDYSNGKTAVSYCKPIEVL